MLVRRTDPFRDLARLTRRMDDAFRGVPAWDGDNGDTMAAWTPSMDVIEKEDQILLRAELPGMTEEDVELTVENGTLTLQGEKRFEHEESEGQYRRIESRYGSFYRSFSLPNSVDQDRIDARFNKGVLEVTLPKVEKAKPKKISVTVQ